jgi:hypothetical protein
MKNAKKSGVGLAVVYVLYVGATRQESSVLSARTVVLYLLAMMLINV